MRPNGFSELHFSVAIAAGRTSTAATAKARAETAKFSTSRPTRERVRRRSGASLSTQNSRPKNAGTSINVNVAGRIVQAKALLARPPEQKLRLDLDRLAIHFHHGISQE